MYEVHTQEMNHIPKIIEDACKPQASEATKHRSNNEPS